MGSIAQQAALALPTHEWTTSHNCLPQR
jgi:hypothetical protein